MWMQRRPANAKTYLYKQCGWLMWLPKVGTNVDTPGGPQFGNPMWSTHCKCVNHHCVAAQGPEMHHVDTQYGPPLPNSFEPDMDTQHESPIWPANIKPYLDT